MRIFLTLLLLAAAVRAQEPAVAPFPAPTSSPAPTAVPSPASGLREQSLAAIKATIQLPEGWTAKEQSEDGNFVYAVGPEKADPAAGSGLILSVTTKLPERAELKPSEYALELLSSAKEEDGSKLVKSEEAPFKVFRLEHLLESEEGNLRVINLAKANDTTGTLYFVTWEFPDSPDPKSKELRDQILSSLKLDPAF